MKHMLISVVIVIAMSCHTLRQATAQSLSCEQTAKELELRFSGAIQEFDKAAFRQLVSDDAVLINSLGEAKSKQQEVGALNPLSNFTLESFTTKDVKILVCGESNIVIAGKDIAKAKEKGQKESTVQSYRFTRIYEKRQGEWSLVYQQVTNIEE